MGTVAPVERRAGATQGAFPWGPVLGAFALLTVVLSTVVALASRGVDRDHPVLRGPAWLDGWYQYDADWYHGIATLGYDYVPGQQSPSPSSRPTRWPCAGWAASSATTRSRAR